MRDPEIPVARVRQLLYNPTVKVAIKHADDTTTIRVVELLVLATNEVRSHANCYLHVDHC